MLLSKLSGLATSYQLDLFITDWRCQDLFSMFDGHNKSYVQNLRIIGILFDTLLCLQAYSVSPITL